MPFPDVETRRRTRFTLVVALLLLVGLLFFETLAPRLIGSGPAFLAGLVWGVVAVTGLAIVLAGQFRRSKEWPLTVRARMRVGVVQTLLGFGVIALGIVASNATHIAWLSIVGFLGGIVIIMLSTFGVPARWRPGAPTA
jgi:hypothetical protein